jgi:hypothetical protein
MINDSRMLIGNSDGKISAVKIAGDCTISNCGTIKFPTIKIKDLIAHIQQQLTKLAACGEDLELPYGYQDSKVDAFMGFVDKIIYDRKLKEVNNDK